MELVSENSIPLGLGENDVVMLKNGGPYMLVEGIGEDQRVSCIQVRDGLVTRQFFPASALFCIHKSVKTPKLKLVTVPKKRKKKKVRKLR